MRKVFNLILYQRSSKSNNEYNFHLSDWPVFPHNFSFIEKLLNPCGKKLNATKSCIMKKAYLLF